MNVYLWASYMDAVLIQDQGLAPGARVFRHHDDWQGEVCFEVTIPYEIKWEKSEEQIIWMAVLRDSVKANQLRIFKRKRNPLAHSSEMHFHPFGPALETCQCAYHKKMRELLKQGNGVFAHYGGWLDPRRIYSEWNDDEFLERVPDGFNALPDDCEVTLGKHDYVEVSYL